MSDPKRPVKRLDVLEPKLAAAWLLVQALCRSLGVRILIVETARLQERQDWLYAQGRTRPGEIVTWTRSSDHKPDDVTGLGRALDYRFAGRDPWGEQHPWHMVGAMFQQRGCDYGVRRRGRLIDLGHVYLPREPLRPQRRA